MASNFVEFSETLHCLKLHVTIAKAIVNAHFSDVLFHLFRLAVAESAAVDYYMFQLID